jgi:hypothetical protein
VEDKSDLIECRKSGKESKFDRRSECAREGRFDRR